MGAAVGVDVGTSHDVWRCWANVDPPGQSKHADVPAAAYFPAAHASHASFAPLGTMPDGQSMQLAIPICGATSLIPTQSSSGAPPAQNLPTAHGVVLRRGATSMTYRPGGAGEQPSIPSAYVLLGQFVTCMFVVYVFATTRGVVSVVETHETCTAPAAGLAARLEVMANDVAPIAIGAPTVVIVRTFPTVAAVCAPLDGVAAIVTAASAAKMALLYVHVIVLPTASCVVMPRASAFEVGVAPAKRVLSVDVPVVTELLPAASEGRRRRMTRSPTP